MTDKVSTDKVEKGIEEIMGSVVEDLKKLVKNNGALVIVAMAGYYLWKKLK